MESFEVFVVGDEQTATGFGLSGIRSYSINDKNQEQIYDELKDKKAILILSSSASKIFAERLEKLKANSIVIEIPEKEEEEYTTIKKIIKNTIGFELKGY